MMGAKLNLLPVGCADCSLPRCPLPSFRQASAFVVFPDIMSACKAAAVLRSETSVDAVEMFDRASLRECEGNEDMTNLVPDIKREQRSAGSPCPAPPRAAWLHRMTVAGFSRVFNRSRHSPALLPPFCRAGPDGRRAAD